jgi:cell division protein FtsB
VKQQPRTTTPEVTAAARRRRRRLVHVALVLIGCVIFIDALVGDQGVLATRQARREYEEVATRLQEARLENARLRELSERLRDDPATIEELARRELSLVFPAEKLFIVRNVRPVDDSAR